MKTQRLTRVMLAGAVALALTALTVLLIALPATAGPTAQDWTPIPTPTEYPLTDLSYVWEVVPPDDAPRTFPGQEADGMTFGETTAVSRYPVDMDFSITITTDAEIDRVNLTIRDPHDNLITPRARLDDATKTWTATLNTRSYYMPIGTPFDFAWCIRKTGGEEVCSEFQRVALWDPAQEWFRMESEYVILYWYGFGENNPEQIAREFAYAAKAAYQRRVDVFGRDINHKFVNVIYPDEQATTAAFPGAPGVDVLRFGVAFMPLDTAAFAGLFPSCQLSSVDYSSQEAQIEFQVHVMLWHWAYNLMFDALARDGCTDDLGCANTEPVVWVYGLAYWLSIPNWYWDHDQRLHNLAMLQDDIPPLEFFTWDTPPQVKTDGCGWFDVDMGTSFVNWLALHYGIETHRQIVELMTPTEDMPRGMSFEDAIQQATGKPFDELENEWRAYLELPPLE